MIPHDTRDHDFANECGAAGDAPGIAAAAALLEIGDRLGLVSSIATGNEVSVSSLADSADLPEVSVAGYLEALESAGIIVPVGTSGSAFRAAEDFSRIRHQAGFVSWTMNANRPFIENARAFLSDPSRGTGIDMRDGREVAVSSEWMGSTAFYPAALSTIVGAKPEVVVDLGSGTCRLLIEILHRIPQAQAVGLDLDGPACAAAREQAAAAGVADRLRVVERSIQSIADDPSPLEGADVIHGGFVFHDMFPEEEETADRVLANCRESLREGGMMAITEAVPYLRNERERRFGAAVTYFHRQFMKRRLLSEHEWKDKLRSAGFRQVDSIELPFPSGRLFVAQR